MSNDVVRWTRKNVDNHETDNNRKNIHCDNCLVNSSDSCKDEYNVERWTRTTGVERTTAPTTVTIKRRKKRRSVVLETTAINSCHRPLFSATRKSYRFLNFKLVTLFLIFNYLEFLTYRTADAAIIDSQDFSKGGHYTHTWAVHIPNGDESGRADQVAADHGFVNLGKVSF